MVLISKQFGFVVNMLRGQIDTHLSSKSGGEVEKEEDCYHRSADLLYCTSSELHSSVSICTTCHFSQWQESVFSRTQTLTLLDLFSFLRIARTEMWSCFLQTHTHTHTHLCLSGPTGVLSLSQGSVWELVLTQLLHFRPGQHTHEHSLTD